MQRRILRILALSILSIIFIGSVALFSGGVQQTQAQLVATIDPDIIDPDLDLSQLTLTPGFDPDLILTLGPPTVPLLPTTPPPTTPAPSAQDSDGDGIIDSEDNCPFISGLGTRFGGVNGPNGCPVDSDSDGINDGNDRCPFQAANTSTGCPDGVTSPATATDTPNPLPSLPGGDVCAIATDDRVRVNRRAGPSTDQDIVARMDPTDIYTGVQQSNQSDGTWFELRNGGWVAGYVVRTNAACNSLPLAQPNVTDTPQVITATPQPAVITATPREAIPTTTPGIAETATPVTQDTAPTVNTWGNLPNSPALSQVFANCTGQISLINQLPVFTIRNLTEADVPCEAAQSTLQSLLYGSPADTPPPSQAVLAGADGNLYLHSNNSLSTLTSSAQRDIMPQVSPNGRQAAHIRAAQDGSNALHLLNIEQGVSLSILSSNNLLNVQQSRPEWLDENTLLVTLGDAETSGLYTLDVSSPGESLPSELIANAANPDYSAQLGMIAFERPAADGRRIVVANANGAGEMQVTTSGDCRTPEFGGNRLYFTCGNTTYSYTASGVNELTVPAGGINTLAADVGNLAIVTTDGTPYLASPTGADLRELAGTGGTQFQSISAANF